MEKQANPIASRMRSLLGFLLLLAIPCGLAVMYPHDAKEAYERAGQLMRGEYGPVDLIPADGKLVQIQPDALGVTDVPLPSVAEAVAAEEARATRALHEAAVLETLAHQAEPASAAASVRGAPALNVSEPGAAPATPPVSSPNQAPSANQLPSATPAGTFGQPSAQPTGTPVGPVSAAPAIRGSSSGGGAAPDVALASVQAAVSGALNTTPAAKTPALVYEAPRAPVSGPKGALPVVKMDLTAAAGVWSGEFMGPASGKLSLVASQDGVLRGRLTPDATRRAVIVEGRVTSESGDVEFSQRVPGKPSPWTFIGRLSPGGGSGQWTSADPVQPPGTWDLQRGNADLEAARAVMKARLAEGR